MIMMRKHYHTRSVYFIYNVIYSKLMSETCTYIYNRKYIQIHFTLEGEMEIFRLS